MHICVLARQTIEWVCLYHHDEASPKLEVSVARVDSGSNGHVSNSRDGVVAE